LIGTPAGFSSEWWPASNRNAGRHHVGIPGRLRSESADRLAAIAKEVLAEDPFSGTVLVFRARRADRVKLLVWDGTGLVLVSKRLEQRAFKWPPITDGVMRLSPAQLAALVEGLDWSRVHVPEVTRPTAVQ
jgi:transposase